MIRRWRWRITAAVTLALIAAAAWVRLGPLPPDLLAATDDESTVVVDRHGTPLYEARSTAGNRALRLDAAALPASIVDATVAAEDHRFFGHYGVDPIAVGRALVSNFRALGVVEGGSTITQQTAKLLLDRRAPTRRGRGFSAKLEEAILALRLEHRLSKRQILALYLNLAPYGNQIVGAGRASQVYFGVSASLLTTAQAAFLAALPQRPSAYNPYRDPAPALRRQRRIIDALVHEKRISSQDAQTARSEHIQVQPLAPAFAAPHFVEMVLASADARYRRRIDTTLDAGLQQTVVDIIHAHRRSLAQHGAANVAVVVLDNATSEWLAWEGSGDYFDRDHGGSIDGVVALRQPGSALKPFVYALAFETGDTPASVVPDVPSTYPTAVPGIVYTPRNYDGTFHGPLRVRQALAGSQNVPAVAVTSRIGVPDLLRFLRSVGFTSFDRTASHYGLGVALGNAEVTLAEMVGAYAALARGGVWQRPRAIVANGEPPETRSVLSERSAFWVSDILSDDDARAYVFGRGGNLEFPFAVAVKTGTSQAYRDNWTIGFSRDVTVGVWVGNFDRKPLIGSTGVTGAAPIFHAVMLAAQRYALGHEEVKRDIVARPAGLGEQTICALSGMRAGDACPLRVREWLPSGFSRLPCNWHHSSDEGLLTIWPDQYRAWAAAHGLDDGGASRRTTGLVRQVSNRSAAAIPIEARFEITSPAPGGTYLIDPTLRAEFQMLPLRSIGGAGAVGWTIDGHPIASAEDDAGASWPLRRGSHIVRARDSRGRVAETTISVR